MKTLLFFLAIVNTLNVFRAEALDAARSPDHDYDPPLPGTYTLPVITAAADGALLDTSEHPVSLRKLMQGRVIVLSFIYTRCAAAKACPYATGVLRQLHLASAKDTVLAKNLRLVSLSFDPENDTPERMAAYAQIAAAHPNAAPWDFLTAATPADLKPILAAYGQAVDKKRNPLDYTGPLNHTLRVFLIDRDANIRNIYSSETLDPRLVLADIRTLLLQSAEGRLAPSATPRKEP